MRVFPALRSRWLTAVCPEGWPCVCRSSQRPDPEESAPRLNLHRCCIMFEPSRVKIKLYKLWQRFFIWSMTVCLRSTTAVREYWAQRHDNNVYFDNDKYECRWAFSSLRACFSPAAVWEAMACASGGGLASCASPDFDEHCSTRHKSTRLCSPRPSEALTGKTQP